MDQYIIYLVFIGIGLLWAYGYFFSKKARIKRKLRKAITKRIADFKGGEAARIIGRVEVIDEPLNAPLSKRKCAYYHVNIQQKGSGKYSNWTTIIDEYKSGRFVINDGMYYTYFNNHKIKAHIVDDRSYKSGFLNDASEALENYLRSKGNESEGMLGFNKTLEYNEGILEPGEHIAVYGIGVWKEATELKLPERYGMVLEITPDNDDHIYLSDDPDTTIRN